MLLTGEKSHNRSSASRRDQPPEATRSLAQAKFKGFGSREARDGCGSPSKAEKPARQEGGFRRGPGVQRPATDSQTGVECVPALSAGEPPSHLPTQPLHGPLMPPQLPTLWTQTH